MKKTYTANRNRVKWTRKLKKRAGYGGGFNGSASQARTSYTGVIKTTKSKKAKMMDGEVL